MRLVAALHKIGPVGSVYVPVYVSVTQERCFVDPWSNNQTNQQCCGTGTVGTVTFCLIGTRTVIKWNH
jgi:hypothetical protein